MSLPTITNDEYKKILEYYNISPRYSNRQNKKLAHRILSQKLCRCIKKLQPIQKSRAVGICTKTIFNRKGYTRRKFKCKGKPYVEFEVAVKKKTRKNRR